MSFIYDNNKLILALIKAAVDHDAKFNKTSQNTSYPLPYSTVPNTTPVSNLNILNYYTLTKKLADNLKMQYRGVDPNAPLITAKKDIEINIYNSVSLGNFLQYALDNEIKIDGQQIVYGSFTLVPDKEKWLPTDAETSQFGIEKMNGNKREPNKSKYYVNPDLLVKYINYLLKLASSKDKDKQTQRMIKVMLGGIIEKVNNLFGTEMTTDYKSPEKVIQPNEIIDRVPKTISDNNIAQEGVVALKYGDIASDVALRNWVSTNLIEISGNQSQPITVNNSNRFDYCVVVRYLYNRAKYLLINKSTSEDLKSKYNEYVKQMIKVGPTLQSPNGKNCDIGASIAQTQTTTSPQVAGYGPTDISKKQKLDNPTINNLINSLPLRYNLIDLNKISQFLDYYSRINPEIAQTFSDAGARIKEISVLTGNKMQFGLPTNIDTVKTWLKDGYKDQVHSLLQNFIYTLKYVGDALLNLKSNYADYESSECQFSMEQAHLVDKQIINSGSIWENNNLQIQTLLNNILPAQKG
jgi:hypothetical protein